MDESIFYFIRFTFFYFLYLVFIPAKVMGLKLTGKKAGEHALQAMIASHVAIISCVYALGLLHIYNTATLCLGLLIVVLAFWKFRGVSYKEQFLRLCNWMSLTSGGQYKFSIYAKRTIKRGVQNVGRSLLWFVRTFFSKHILEYLVLLASFGILIDRKWSLVFDNYAYLTSDMYVHHEWINFMEQGDIFYDGVYPFGMHNMISAFHKLAGLNLNIVFRYWGAYNCLLLAVLLYFLARRIFHSPAVAILPVVIYCVTDFAGHTYGYRTIYTLPQENGMLFLFPCIYYFGRFLKRGKWKDGIYFAMSAAIILSMHFYSIIFAVLLCGSVCIPFIRKVFRFAMIKKLLASVGLIALISLTPYAVGLASGKYWQGSMTWAMGVMGSGNQTAETSDETEESTYEDTDSEESLESADSVEADGKAEQISSLDRLKETAIAIYDLQVEKMMSYWGKIFWACMGLFLLYYVVLWAAKRLTWKEQMYGGIWVFLALVILMYSYWILGIPKIMNEERMNMFIGYVAPLMLVFPIELICRICSFLPRKGKIAGIASALCTYSGVAALFYVTYGLGYVPVQSYFYLEPSLAAKACVKADEEFETGTWTVVSPVDELSLVRNRGYHYELWEFISAMEMYEEDRYLEIPTKQVLFVLEKKPIVYNQYRVPIYEYDFEPLNKEDADTIFDRELFGISETGVMKFYNDLGNRRIMEAKLACWIEEYSKAFPEQMEVYMEDEDCIVYLFTQNLYMMNNFAIDYGYNEHSELDYYKELRARKLEREEDISDVQKKIEDLEQEAVINEESET